MKKLYILLLAMLCLTVATCKKDVEPYVFNADIKVTDIKTNMAVIEAINEEEGFDRLEAVVLCSADEKVKEPKQYKMTYEDEAFKANVDGLLQDTKYYYKIIFTGKYNSVETEVSSFETEKIVLPIVTTAEATEVTTTRATCGGNVTSDGGGTITARGVCWSTNQNPTIEDNKTTNGSGTGVFTSNLSNLSSQTTYYVRAYATNEAGTAYGEEISFTTLEILKPTVKTNNVTSITESTATCGGNVTSDGNGTVSARGICWSTSPNPTIADNKTTDGSGIGSFTSSMTNLKANTTYYVRAYATNEKGTAYGEVKSFTTSKKAVSLPDVLKTTVSNVTSTTAVFGSGVFSDGGGIVTARGFCWSSTTETPTIANSSFTTNGSGLGSFSADVTGLKASTQYYVRAYATNEAGTAYGEIVAFYTSMEEQPEEPIILPTVTTTEVTNITVSSATCGGNVTSDGNGTVSARGICWSTSPNPTIDDNKTTDGSGIGSFTSSLSNLASQTTYYVRAYATNEAGTAYGEENYFITLVEEAGETISGTENGHDYVDLGLPSGLKWATCNVGANAPEEYGDYYAWGEITTKTEYTEDNSLTYGKQMNDISGNSQYDAATANWGGDWRMPTKAEQEELLNDCTWTWTTYNGVNGYNVEGPNGNSLFLPAAGFRDGSSLGSAGSLGSYWSSTPDEIGNYGGSYFLVFNSDSPNMIDNFRDFGHPVRSVFGGNFTGPEEQPEEPIILPTVMTDSVKNITSNSATCGGNATSDGNGTVTARGICWSTSPNPTIDDNKTTDGSGIGSFTSSLSNLASQTTYYVRAYATNEAGTSYGEEFSFTTLEFKNETFTVNGVSFTMIAVEGGTFKMGAQSSSSGGDNYDSDAESVESPVHDVTLSSYYIGETEVTQELWEAVMGSNPSDFSGYPQRPVENVSWDDCQEFITKLNNLTGKNFRLPTEAEWEYAARGGNKSNGYKYSGSNTIGNVAWYNDNSSSTTHDVKTKQANELGIYDMSGNVWEWCQDRNGSYSSGSQTNPTGPSSGSFRVSRGGTWISNARHCRVSYRYSYNSDYRLITLGLRLSLSQD